jgi:hypothetical protein
MKLKTTSFVEHQTSGKQHLLAETTANIQLLAPGAGCSCWGHSSCSCCSWGASLIRDVGNANTTFYTTSVHENV